MGTVLAVIDILLATYNGEKYIAEQIASLRAQTFVDWRLLISDDGSTDGTLEIVRELQLADSRIELLPEHEPCGSSTGNFLYLLKQSAAPYVMFCDQDDVWLPEKIEHTYAKMCEVEAGFNVGLPAAVYSDATCVDENLEVIAPSHIGTLNFDAQGFTLYRALVDNVCQGSTMLMNRALVERVLALPVPAEFPQHDYWAAAIALAEGELTYLDEQTLLYRQHANNDVGIQLKATPAERIGSIAKTAVSGNWAKEMGRSETAFVRRAQILLDSDLKMPADKRAALEVIATSSSLGFPARIKILKKYQLFKEAGAYKKLYQTAGVLFSSFGA